MLETLHKNVDASLAIHQPLVSSRGFASFPSFRLHANICVFSICVRKWRTFCGRVRPLRAYRLDFTSWKNLGFNRKSFRPSKARSGSWGPPQEPLMARALSPRMRLAAPAFEGGTGRDGALRPGWGEAWVAKRVCPASPPPVGKKILWRGRAASPLSPFSKPWAAWGPPLPKGWARTCPPPRHPRPALFLPDQFIRFQNAPNWRKRPGTAEKRNLVTMATEVGKSRWKSMSPPRLLRLLLRWQGEEAGWQQWARPGAGREAKGRARQAGMEKGRGPRSLGSGSWVAKWHGPLIPWNSLPQEASTNLLLLEEKSPHQIASTRLHFNPKM